MSRKRPEAWRDATPGGEAPSTQAAREHAWRSNIWARAIYGGAFRSLAAQAPELDRLDLDAVRLHGLWVPLLRSGSNGYQALNRARHRLTDAVAPPAELSDLPLFVIPENARVLRRVLGRGWSPEPLARTFAPGALRHAGIYPCDEILPDARDVGLCLRQFDSHLSVYAYRRILTAIGRVLGIEMPEDTDVIYEARRATLDLAGRFSDRICISFFPSGRHFVSADETTGNRGMLMRYENAAAPLDGRLLIIGDSHSYSGLAPLASFFFRQVDFYWGSRHDGFGDRSAEVMDLIARSRWVIEEVSERFFLRNFCDQEKTG